LYGTADEPEWPVLVTVVLALVLGSILQIAVTSATSVVSNDGVSVAVPASWTTFDEEGALVAARDASGGPTTARVVVTALARTAATAEGGAKAAADQRSLQLADAVPSYRSIGARTLTVGGRAAAQLDYVMLARDRDGVVLPVLMRARDTIVPSGDRFLVLTFATESTRWRDLTEASFPRATSVFGTIRDSWRVP
jgi:hypothetical protein